MSARIRCTCGHRVDAPTVDEARELLRLHDCEQRRWVVDQLTRGRTMQAVADDLGVTKQRVQQVAAAAGRSFPAGRRRSRCATQPCARAPRPGNRECPVHQHRRQHGLPAHAAHDLIGTERSGFGLRGLVDRDEHGVLCHECGTWFRSLVQHLRLTHDMTVADYRTAHDLPAGVPLTCLSTSALIGASARERIGTPEWARFEQARAATQHESQVAATAASREQGAGARAARAGASSREWVGGRKAALARDDQHWLEQWDRVRAWAAHHDGAWPSRANPDPAARALGRWVNTQREEHRRGVLPPGRRRVLEDGGLDLTPGRGAGKRRPSAAADAQRRANLRRSTGTSGDRPSTSAS